ncbi:MAG: DUF6728 family protein [Bacteroidota bacterium]
MIKKFLHYANPLNLFKKEKGDLNLRAMHTINKISILVFLVTLLILIFRWIN